MASLRLVDCVSVFWVMVLFIVNVYCQRIRFEETSARSVCSSGSRCLPLRRCPTYRNLPRTDNVGVTCGPGRDESRRVCCPVRRRALQAPPVPPRTGPLPDGPSIPVAPPVAPTINSNSVPGCGRSKITSENVRVKYIMGGENSTEGQWPWMVAITRGRPSIGNYGPHCSGFLIDQRHVMSAAHCFTNRDVNWYQARIGNIDQTIAEIFTINRIALPSEYRNGRFYGDIAILTLDRDVSPDVGTPICLPNAEIMAMTLTNTGTTVAGWGMIGPDGPVSLTLKHLQHMPVWDNEECNEVFLTELTSFRRQFQRGVDNTFLCAGYKEGGKDACGGDSGGPLMKQKDDRWYVVGIVSFGNSCGRVNMPGGYTKVSEYMDWISNTLRN